MYKLTGTLFLGLISISAIGCGGAAKERSDANPSTLVSRNHKLNSFVYLFSKPDAKYVGRCWHTVESGKQLSSSELSNAKSTLLTPKSIEDSALAETLRRTAEAQTATLLQSTSGALGACTGTIVGAISTVTAMLVPGAQPISPVVAVSTVSSLIGCGLAGAAASDAIWNAYYYSSLQSSGPKSDLAAGRVGQSDASRKILVDALESTKFHTTENVCQPN